MEKPKLYTMEIASGVCYHKEIWFGLPSDVEKRQLELKAMAESWGWLEPIIIATEVKGRGDR